jgi:hypothetical protein
LVETEILEKLESALACDYRRGIANLRVVERTFSVLETTAEVVCGDEKLADARKDEQSRSHHDDECEKVPKSKRTKQIAIEMDSGCSNTGKIEERRSRQERSRGRRPGFYEGLEFEAGGGGGILTCAPGPGNVYYERYDSCKICILYSLFFFRL